MCFSYLHRFDRWARKLSAQVFSVLVPRGCAGCNQPDEVLCPQCSAGFNKPCARQVPDVLVSNGLILSCASYDSTVRSAILQWKDHGDEEVGALFAGFLSQLIAGAVRDGLVGDISDRENPISDIVIVPVPSSRRSAQHRGYVQTFELSRLVVRQLKGFGISARGSQCLRFSHITAKSVQRSSAAVRSSRLHSGVRVVEKKLPSENSTVVLLDDIVTTGSTLLACARRLARSGVDVSAIFTLAATTD